MTDSIEEEFDYAYGALALKEAAQAMFIYAFFLSLPVGVMTVLLREDIDQFGWIIMGVLSLKIVLLVIAAILILKRQQAGMIIWWILSPLVLIQVPVGTIVGMFVISYLRKPEARDVMAGRRVDMQEES